MATTYELITSQVLASAAATVTFSSIPQTYKDLVIKASANTNLANAAQLIINLNGAGTNIYNLDIEVVNTTFYATSGTTYIGAIPGQDASNSFGLLDIYFSNYSATNAEKNARFTYKAEYPAVNAYVGVAQLLFDTTAAISSISLSANNYVANTKFYLYGIKNS